MSVITPLRRCAIYTRKSTEEGLEQQFNSLDAQRESCEVYIQSQAGEGWICLPDNYDDGGWSGGNMDRPALRRLLGAIVQRRIDVVVVYKVDRLTRSLMDFARIVETFDGHNVSFVSVTQAFNTTSSMGRLTLNVLLSFAQFEREVTGERIRDKIAASRAKGMWMGGNIPLGYDLGDRRLDVNIGEAATVRHIFERYLIVQSLPKLTIELARDGIHSKRWTSRAGKDHGGLPMSCGAVAHVLKNRLYIGEAVHKGTAHIGEHKPIVTQALFDAVQAQLAANSVLRTSRKSRAAASPLTGKLYDSDGQPMRVSFSYGRGKRMYRYYVSETLLASGKPGAASNRAGMRLSAHRIEYLLETAVSPLRLNGSGGDIFDAVVGATALGDRVVVQLDVQRLGFAVQAQEVVLAKMQMIDPGARFDAGMVYLSIDMRPALREAAVTSGDAALLRTEAKGELAALLRTAHAKLAQLNASPLAPEHHCQMAVHNNAWTRQRVLIGLLAPDIQKAILAGTAPAELTYRTMLEVEIPMEWRAQRRLFGCAL